MTDVDNPKLLAIQAVKAQATMSQTNLGAWVPACQADSSTPATTIDAGLTDDVWTSPVADDYRARISAATSGCDLAMSNIVSALTSAENEIYDAGLEKVPADSEEAKWPGS